MIAARIGVLVFSLALAVSASAAGLMTARDALKQPETWFKSDQGRGVLENVLSNQSPLGGWPKNTNTAAVRFTGDSSTIKGTFDNGATTDELRLLTKAFNATREPRYRAAILKGLDHILLAQYPTGGWPQFYPPGKAYHRHITYNDNAMLRLMEFLRDVATDKDFAFIDTERRTKSQAAFDRGIDCIVQSQIKVKGPLTVWCAQHDEITLEPRPARAFELVSLSGSESSGLLLLLMSLEKPSPEVVRAVHAGAKWYETTKLTGLRQEKIDDDKKIIRDPNAPPLWARFYEMETNRPIFSGRDSVKKYDMSEIESERRNGYAWYGSWGVGVAKRYGQWRQQWPENAAKSQ
ncbi:MAG: pectate lyase [Opitutaceae bacterium]|nr:pectate lyase [Verrucomicrobiales bacterium]